MEDAVGLPFPGSDWKMEQTEGMQAKSPRLAETKKDSRLSVKKAYASPQLVVYGDIREITRTLNSLMGNADGMVIGPLILKTGGF